MTVKTLVTSAFLAASFTGSAVAQSNCIAYEPLRRTLEENGVRLQGSGLVPLVSEDGKIEIWAAPDGRWSILVVGSNGVACVVVSGVDYHQQPQGEPV